MLKPSAVFFSFVILAPAFSHTLLSWDFSFAEKAAGVPPSRQVHWMVHFSTKAYAENSKMTQAESKCTLQTAGAAAEFF